MTTITAPPLAAIDAALTAAQETAGGTNYRCLSASHLGALCAAGEIQSFLGDARACIVGLPDGYAVHEVCGRGLGQMVTRIYVEGARA
jgi:hypothetical protein